MCGCLECGCLLDYMNVWVSGMWMLIGLYECVGVWNVDAYWTAQCICGICSGQMCCMLQGQKDLKWFFYLMWPVISDTKSLPFLPSLSRTHTQAQKLSLSKSDTKKSKHPGTALCVPQTTVCIQTSLAVTQVQKHLGWCPSGTNL